MVNVFTVVSGKEYIHHAEALRVSAQRFDVDLDIKTYPGEDRWSAKIKALMTVQDLGDIVAMIDSDCLFVGRPDFEINWGMRKDPRPWGIGQMGGHKPVEILQRRFALKGIPFDPLCQWNTGVIIGPSLHLAKFAKDWLEEWTWYRSVGGTVIDQPSAYIPWENHLSNSGCQWQLPVTYNWGIKGFGWPDSSQKPVIIHGAGSAKNSPKWLQVRASILAGKDYHKP